MQQPNKSIKYFIETAILLEILGKRFKKKKVPKLELDKKKFNYKYVTGYHVNTQNKMINHVYDLSWAIFSDQEILIYRNYDKLTN